jgi:hypothetical protein
VSGPSLRRKAAIVAIVAVGHITLLSLAFSSRMSIAVSNWPAQSSKPLVVNYRTRPVLSTDRAQPFAESGFEESTRLSKPGKVISSAPVHSTLSASSIASTGTITTEPPLVFFNGDDVDSLALPNDLFATYLAELLPVNHQSAVLKIWILADGSTIDIQCVDGDCDDLKSLSPLTWKRFNFVPARKQDVNVASIKLIEIDSRTAYGL